MLRTDSKRLLISLLLLVLFFGVATKCALAQKSLSVLYVPLIGVSLVPDPLALPNGAGIITYHYAVKNFLSEIALSNIKVVDNKCAPIVFITGDDNNNAMLESNETWRYICAATLTKTTQNVVTATGMANNITATQKAYATVVVGSNTPPPLVNIVNVTKVAYPLSLPSDGGTITFTYKVNNPGIVPLNTVSITDDKCSPMSGKLGDTNGNNLLDTQEVWIYTCTTKLKQTTTNTARVSAFANGLQAIGYATLTVKVDAPPILNTTSPSINPNVKNTLWAILSGILITLIICFLLTQKKNQGGRR